MTFSLTSCERATQTDSDDLPTPTATHNHNAVASSVRSISHHIANAVVSPDTAKVVNELVIPTNVPVTLTDYQQAYLESIHTTAQARQQANLANNADVIFARNVIVHYSETIMMAKIELATGTNADVKKFAEDILMARQNDIAVIQNWLNNRPNSAPNATPQLTSMQQEYQSGMDDMMNQMMMGIMSPNPDIAFVQAMIPHHKGILALAQVELKYGEDNKIRHLADNIIDNQEAEIQLLQQWLQSQPSS